MKKKILTLLAAAVISANAMFIANPISMAGAVNLVVDNSLVTTDVAPVLMNNRTLVPMRALFEALNATVNWDGSTRTATATKGETVVSVQIGSNTAYVNNVATILDVPAQTIEGRTMVPARFIAESLGATVTWDKATETVNISTSSQTTPSPQCSKVYVTKTGKHYHCNSNCNGSKYYESTLEDAKSRGLTPCSKCVK